MKAHSDKTGKTYDSWYELVEAEANGYVVVAIVSTASNLTGNPLSWPVVYGPYVDKPTATRARNRIRTKFKREQRDYPNHTFSLFIRPAWKEGRQK